MAVRVVARSASSAAVGGRLNRSSKARLICDSRVPGVCSSLRARCSLWRTTKGLFKSASAWSGVIDSLRAAVSCDPSASSKALHERVGQGPEEEPVHASPARAGAVPVVRGIVDHGCDMHARLERELLDGGPAHGQVEPARGREDGVVDRLGVEPPPVHPPEQAIVGVDLRGPGRGSPPDDTPRW